MQRGRARSSARETQDSHRALLKAIDGGRAQKRNVQARGAHRLAHSLVIGLFIPQAHSTQAARIHIADPDWNEIDQLLSERSPDAIARSVVQIDLAKHLSMLGLTSLANYLGTTETEELTVLPTAVRTDLSSRTFPLVMQRQAPPERVGDTEESPAWALRIEAPPGLGERLLETEDIRELLDELANDASSRRWSRRADDTAAPLPSTLGFAFSLDFDR